MSAPKAAASFRALRRRSRLPVMSPTIAGICASAMTRRLAEEAGMVDLLPQAPGDAQCGTFVFAGRRHIQQLIDKEAARHYFFCKRHYGERSGDRCSGEKANYPERCARA